MSTTLLPVAPTTRLLQDQIEYAPAGVHSKVLWQTPTCQYKLLCLAAGTTLAEHTATRDAVVHVIAGSGTFNLDGQDIALQPGVFIAMPAHTPHALTAIAALSFVLTLSTP